jgi:hypothetical protein
MAALGGKANIAAGSLTASTTYNIIVASAPTNQRVRLRGLAYYGAYNTNGTPGLLQYCKAASAGSGGTSVTPLPSEPECTETFQSTWATQPSSAPSSIVAIDTREVNPQLGVEVYFPQGQEDIMKGGGFNLFQFTPGTTSTYGGFVPFEE